MGYNPLAAEQCPATTSPSERVHTAPALRQLLRRPSQNVDDVEFAQVNCIWHHKSSASDA
ncbi:hypothetical protein FIBSPDRAFT_859572 [Athelia psychrophila]|uniref:Uncharacterized protein n=1 Tax=Athelia psychrophila TaxID=1759441 RepID=A0A166KV25_9AGAM|nr:hypothetical protein FIBSPDRAFT_859572 [Fibularhizoctonia sp. CBS 109695]